jgi:hypothetical protein
VRPDCSGEACRFRAFVNIFEEKWRREPVKSPMSAATPRYIYSVYEKSADYLMEVSEKKMNGFVPGLLHPEAVSSYTSLLNI